MLMAARATPAATRRHQQGPQEGIDHLFLLPERVLGMDSAQLRQDLAGLDFSVQLLHTAPQGNVWLSGAAPVDATQRPSSAHTNARSSASNKGKESSNLSQKEREERIRALRDRQNEERQRKLEELKQQALAAQKFREQKEEERRRRIDDLRQRDTDRRHQVEERKRQIWEAERDRREAILRKNQEREARIDSKRKNERSSIVFAFGSSTPRMLEPADTGGSFWGTRRATSTTNVMMFTAVPLTRRSSERELDGSKKRAASASGLDRKPGEGEDGEIPISGTAVPIAAQQRVNRRKTDLMPTIPSPRDLTPTSSSRPSSVHLQGNRPFSKSPGLRSGEVTPSSPSRPLSALSQQSMNSVNSGVSLRARPVAAPRRPRPISIAVTGVTHESDSQATRTSHRHSIAGEIRDSAKPPLPKVHAAKKPKSDVPLKKTTDKVLKSSKASPRITPKATPLQSPGTESLPSLTQDQEEPKEATKELKSEPVEKTEEVSVEKLASKLEESIDIAEHIDMEVKSVVEVKESVVETTSVVVETKPVEKEELTPKPAEISEQEEVKPPETTLKESEVGKSEEKSEVMKESAEKPEASDQLEQAEPEVDMTASMIAKIRITTEEEAKAALAERRRLAREQAEREAELERQRLEEEKRLEEERLRQEEEEQRRFEEEQLRLVEEARKAEEERLLQAIQENERREEEERKRKEEEAKAKAEREEAERKAREEAERLRREMDERLRKEEEERIARRKRVEAIMLRTRGKGSTPSSTPTKDDGDNEEGKEESPMEESKDQPGEAGAVSEHTQQQEQALDSDIEPSGDLTTGNGQISQKQQSLLMDSFSTNIMDHIQENGGGEKKVSSSSSSDLLLIDNSSNVKPMETSEDLITSASSVLPLPPQLQQSNGHRNGVEYGAVDFVSVDNVKQNNTTNNLLDFSEFDAFSTNNVMLNATQQPTAATEFEQILDLSSVPATGKLSNEDNVNSNVMNNGPAPPFIAFQDNLAKKTDTNSVTDLLS